MRTNGTAPPAAPVEDNFTPEEQEIADQLRALGKLSDAEWRQLDAGRAERRARVLGDRRRSVAVRAVVHSVAASMLAGLALYLWTDGTTWIAILGAVVAPLALHGAVMVSLTILRREQ